ncbi:hypothetical protein [Lampropedia aestuarii]|nr:hypothetical protein [Lampropedia aestuarii]MDH5859197.1 hypothetical protein [Lampropedia aestuarii]
MQSSIKHINDATGNFAGRGQGNGGGWPSQNPGQASGGGRSNAPAGGGKK